MLALATGEPTIVRLDLWLPLRARTHPDHPAVVGGGGAVTYAELEALAASAARRLAALGVGEGDRVATALPAGLEFVVLLHAAPKLGAALVPLDPRSPAAERRWMAKLAEARLVLDAAPEGADADVPLRGQVDPDTPWTIVFTSGTTGRPRPVPLSHRNHGASAHAAAWGLGVAPDDAWLCPLPVHHVGGLAVLVRSAVYGTATILHARFEPERVVASLAGGEATLVSLVPTMLRRLLGGGLERTPRLRALLLGGSAAPPELLRRAVERGLPVVRTYGMTETASLVALARAPDAGARPLPGVDLRLGPEGEILVRGPMVARSSLDADGWFRTGDRGRIDERGLLHVDGRMDDVIVTGGENVVPVEVERALLSHPAVVDAAVVGRPDHEWGEAVVAYAVASRPVEAAELRDRCRAVLSGFKVPKEVRFVDEIPRNAAGKVDRRALGAEGRRPGVTA